MASGGGDFKKHPFWKKALLLWTPSGAQHVGDWISGWALDPLVVAPVLFGLLLWWAGAVDPDAIAGTFAMLVALSPIWLPIYLFVMFWVIWMHYVRFKFWFSQKHVLLKVELPPEVTKSPLAMEVFLTGMHNSGGEGTFLARMWGGKFRAVWSLEIASNEGRIDFYFYCREAHRNILEAKLYGQYPEAKVILVDDYTTKVPFNLDEYNLSGAEYEKSEPQALPIRTYIDYGLDKNTDTPEIQIDPITSMLEHMSTMGPGEYLWMQIVMKARKKDEWYGFYINSSDAYKDGAKEGIKKITEGAIERAKGLTTDEAEQKKVGSRGSTLLSGGEKLKVEAIEHSLTKNLFECGVRVLYIAKKDKFNGANIGNMVNIFGAYKYGGYNNLMPADRDLMMFNYPWQDFRGIRDAKAQKNLFFRYKHRAYFYVPYDQVPVFMTTEELATLWHFPSSVVKTPALSRVPSRRAEAPGNLPTGPANLPI